jgi:hypothetical protein
MAAAAGLDGAAGFAAGRECGCQGLGRTRSPYHRSRRRALADTPIPRRAARADGHHRPRHDVGLHGPAEGRARAARSRVTRMALRQPAGLRSTGHAGGLLSGRRLRLRADRAALPAPDRPALLARRAPPRSARAGASRRRHSPALARIGPWRRWWERHKGVVPARGRPGASDQPARGLGQRLRARGLHDAGRAQDRAESGVAGGPGGDPCDAEAPPRSGSRSRTPLHKTAPMAGSPASLAAATVARPASPPSACTWDPATSRQPPAWCGSSCFRQACESPMC